MTYPLAVVTVILIFSYVLISEALLGVHSTRPEDEMVIPSGALLSEYVSVPE